MRAALSFLMLLMLAVGGGLVMAQPGQVKHEHEHECHWQLPLKPNYVLVCDGKPDPRPVGTLAKDDCWGEFGDCRGWLIFGWAYPLWILFGGQQ